MNNNLHDFESAEKQEIDGGILFNGENGLQVMKIYDEWYEFKSNMKPKEILENVISGDLVDRLAKEIKAGIEFFKTAKTNKDTEHFRPIRLTKTVEKPADNNA